MDLTLADLREWATAALTMPTMGMERIYWVYLLSALALALWVYLRRRSSAKKPLSLKGFFQYLFPARIYRHKSTWVDFKFMLVNKVVKITCFVVLAGVSTWFARASYFRCVAWFGPAAKALNSPPYWQLVAYTLVSALIMDMAMYLGHFLQHKVRTLWEFHKVHHSAQVMSPITVYRVHPVDDLFAGTLSLVMYGILSGACIYAFPPGLTELTYLRLNLIVFLFYVLGYNLRHSHVWLSYGQFWSHIFMSPAMHQIHHSANPKHFDKNIGFMLSIWDWMFGTLHIPEDSEEADLVFGLGNGEEKEFSGVWRLYTYPFLQVGKSIKKTLFRSGSEKSS